jgi:extracellular factor (EF) 3-hydroxypalmitic acid methyl ester biosynthesis protein
VHLRECGCLNEHISRCGLAITAMDADAEAISTIAGSAAQNPRIKPRIFSVRDALGRTGKELQQTMTFDSIYSLGLFDYLSDRIAIRLLQWFWRMLKPGGRLMIANFHPETHGRAWMEAVMDWWLKYRTEWELGELMAGIPRNEIASTEVYRDRSDAVVYLEAQKRGNA